MSADITVNFIESGAIEVEFPEGAVGPPGEAGPNEIACDDDDTTHRIIIRKVTGEGGQTTYIVSSELIE